MVAIKLSFIPPYANFWIFRGYTIFSDVIIIAQKPFEGHNPHLPIQFFHLHSHPLPYKQLRRVLIKKLAMIS